MIKKYKKLPVVVEAVQLREDTLTELYDFLDITNKGCFQDCGHGIDPEDGKFKITTLEGVHVAKINDYIIKGVKGEFYPCKPDIFEMTYNEVKEESDFKRTIEDLEEEFSEDFTEAMKDAYLWGTGYMYVKKDSFMPHYLPINEAEEIINKYIPLEK